MVSVSVIIPAYNQAHYLGGAIRSVLAQSYGDFEILVVDDGSTDHTAEVVRGIDDVRLFYHYQENRGLSAARNRGLREARGTYLTYLDSDDLFLPRKLELLVGALERMPEAGMAAGQAVPIDEEGRQIGRIFETALPADGAELLLGNPLHVGSVLLRRSWQEQVGPFDERLRSYEDWDMWLRLARAGCPMLSVAEPVSLYRFHTDQMTRNGDQMTQATFEVLDKVFADSSLPAAWRQKRPLAYSRAYLRAAAQAYREEKFEAAGRSLAAAVAKDPALQAGDASKLAASISAWADLPKITDRLAFLERIYGNLPPGMEGLRRRRRGELGRAALGVAMSGYRRGDMAGARHAIRRAIRYRPAFLLNRGALVVLIASWGHERPEPGRPAASRR